MLGESENNLCHRGSSYVSEDPRRLLASATLIPCESEAVIFNTTGVVGQRDGVDSNYQSRLSHMKKSSASSIAPAFSTEAAS